MTLILFWALAAVVCRVVDYVIALSPDRLYALYDTVAIAGFDLITGVIARWPSRESSARARA